MNIYSTWEGFYKYFTEKGKKFILISYSPLDFNKIRFNWFEIFYSNYRFKKYLQNREKEDLTKRENNILDEFLNKRFKGDSEMFKTWSYYSEKSFEKVRNELNIDKNKRNIFLFSNIYWDVGVSDMGKLYDDVIEWVKETIKLLKNENVQLYQNTSW